MKDCKKCKVIKPLCDYYTKSSICKSCALLYAKEYKLNNPEKIKEKGRKLYAKNKVKYNLNSKEWAKNNPDKIEEFRQKRLKLNRERRKEYKIKLIDVMGGKCLHCGFSDIRALQIDHIDGGGAKEMRTRSFKGNYNKHVYNSYINNENKYQLLCANCNWIKKYTNNEFPKYN